jgi:hypothetical protein
MDPAHQHDFLADIIRPKFPAMMRSAHFTELILQYNLLLLLVLLVLLVKLDEFDVLRIHQVWPTN